MSSIMHLVSPHDEPRGVNTFVGELPHMPSLVAKCLAECIGTFILIFTVGTNVLSLSGSWAGVSIGGALMVAIYALGGISGGHFNPAVSFGMALSQMMHGPGMDLSLCGVYMLVQFFTSVCAGFAFKFLLLKSIPLQVTKGFTMTQAGVAEMLYTFMLVLVVLNVAKAQKNGGNQYFGMAIGFVVMAGASGAGVISMGCFNPAVAVALDVSSIHDGFGLALIYTAWELLGSVLAVLVFTAVRPEDFPPSHVPYIFAKLVSEFVGTYMLVLTVGLNVLAGAHSAAWAIAASLSSMIYALGSTSGGHFNPAVSVAVLACRQHDTFNFREFVGYVLVQLAGGVAAAFTFTALYSSQKVASISIRPEGDHDLVQALATEFVYTFVLCFVVLGVAVSKHTKSSEMFGLAIGFCVVVGGTAGGNISGGSFNPAVSFGLASSHALYGGHFYDAALYCGSEILAGFAAALLFNVTHMHQAHSAYAALAK